LEETRVYIWIIFLEHLEVVQSRKSSAPTTTIGREPESRENEKEAYSTPATVIKPNSVFDTEIQPSEPVDTTFHAPKATIETMLSRWNPVSTTASDGS
jgi:hypothetical protein